MSIQNPYNPGPTAEQLQAYLENRLSAAEREQVEAMLEASADDAEALEGLEALGAADAAELTASINRDIDVLTAPEERRKGVVRRLSYVRLTLAAAILISFGGGLWMLSQLQKQNEDRQAFKRHFEPLILDKANAPAQKPEASPGDSSPENNALGSTEGGAFTESATDQTPREQLIPVSHDEALSEDVAELEESDSDDQVYDLSPAPGQKMVTEPYTDAGQTKSLSVKELPSRAVEQLSETKVRDERLRLPNAGRSANDDFAPSADEEVGSIWQGANTPVTTDATWSFDGVEYRNDGEKMDANPQQGVVHGVIRDAENGEPLIGAMVVIPGNTLGAVTNIDGEFTLELEPGMHNLQINYIGYTQKVLGVALQAGQQTDVSAELQPSDLSLSEVMIMDNKSVSKSPKSSISRQETSTLSSAPANRGYTPAPDPFKRGEEAYAAGDFKKAVEWLAMVPASHPQSSEAKLLEANAWLERDKPERAEVLLRDLVASGPESLREQSQWYLALAQIALGKTDSAKALLGTLVKGDGAFSRKAEELLLELDR